MKSNFDIRVKELYEEIDKHIDNVDMLKCIRAGVKFNGEIPKDLETQFFKLVDKVNFSLMEERDNFYGYFLFQMGREINFNIMSATAVNFKNAKYYIYFNPYFFLTLNIDQMESSIKHEIHHVLSMHMIRAKELKGRYSKIAINAAMDIVVNQFLDNIPPFLATLQSINLKYSLELKPFRTFEYYVQNIQDALNLLEESDDGEADDSRVDEDLDPLDNIEQTHDIWEEDNDIDEKTLQNFAEKFVSNAEKGVIPEHLANMISALKNKENELPWNLYLKRLMGTVESNKKKTVTRLNRRQPGRLDLRGEIRNHKAKIAVALDISGSISDEEFRQAIKEVLGIVKNYNHEITIIECDNTIKRTYKVKSEKDVKERVSFGGGTRFTPVFEYANKESINLLVYFTDGKGEEKVLVKPRGYKVLWVISGRGDGLSVEKPYGAIKKLSKVEVLDNMLDLKDLKHDGYSMNSQEPMF